MARPKFKKKKNSSGKIFPWTYDEKDFQYGKIVDNLGTFVYGVTSRKGGDKHESFAVKYDEMYALIDRQEDDGKPNEEDTEKIFACDTGTRFFSIGVADQDVSMQDTYRLYVGAGIRKKFFDFYKICKAEMDELAADYRSRYAGRTDARSKYLNQMANRYADYLDRFEELNNPDAGSKLKAEFDAPALNVLNGLWSGAPKIDARFTFEQCIDGLDPIFEDFMTMLDAGPRCTKVEFHRQQMEQSGWDEKKEKIYDR